MEKCDNGADDDENGAADCDDSFCFNEYHCRAIRADAGADAGLPDAGAPDAGPPDAGVPDAGPPDAGTVVYANACPGLAYTQSCGTRSDAGWRKVVPRATEGLFTTAWAPVDGGEVFVGGTSVHRWNGAQLVDELPDAGPLYFTRLEGRAANDLWAITGEATDGTRLLHRTDAGWALVAHSTALRANDLALFGGEPWLLAASQVARPVDGGFVTWPLPPGTTALFLSVETDGGLWMGGFADPCPGAADAGVCPRVVHGVPGEWFVDDWPCLLGAGAAHVWRRTPNEQVLTGGGFLARRIDGGWTQPEPLLFSAARITGTANDAWMSAYDLLAGSPNTGVAHFNGCVEAPRWLYTSTTPTNPANGITYGTARGGAASWAAAGSWDNAAMRWRGELWTSP